MTLASLGDGMHLFQMSRQNTALKTSLNTLVIEMSSGEKSDLVAATDGDTARFSAIDNRLKVLSSLSYLSSETEFKLSTMQTTLSNFDTQRGALAESLLLVSSESPDFQIEEAGRSASERFGGLVSTLNTKTGGESLFAGKAVDQSALASADDMLSDIMTQIGGATDFDTIQAAVDTWFDDPAGGFATLGYTGDTGDQATRNLDAQVQITLDARADDPGIKAVLKGAAMAALSHEVSGLDRSTQASLLSEAGIQLQSAASDVAQIQGRLGYAEGEVERVSVTQSAEQSALNIARNMITQADPYETATELEAVQLQLETHYTMTARLSQLSLVEYLR